MSRCGSLALGFAIAVGGCTGKEVDGSGGPVLPLPPSGLYGGTSIEISAGGGDLVDLLVIVDNSDTMREEQANLTANFADMIGALVQPPDENGDGAPDWTPVPNLHIGVISGDMGTSGYPIATCDDAERGDDGVLQNTPAAGMAGCDASYPSFLTFDVDLADDPVAVAGDFSCIATLGTGGCGFQQQLFATEKALTVHAAAGAANDGFLRPDAILAILLVTDGEDCSISDPGIFADDDSLGPLGLRCFENQEMVRPVDDFVANILGVKPGHPEQIVVAAIVGVPPDLVELSDAQLASDDIMTRADFENILNDPRMVETVDYSPEGGGNRLVPSCDVPGLGVAFPPRRIVEWVQRLDDVGNNGMVQSICQSDWTDTVRVISRLMGERMRGVCLARPLVGAGGVPLATGEHADCIVRETLVDNGACPRGRFEVGTDSETDGTICQVCQLLDGEDPFLVDSLGTDLRPCADSAANWFYTTEDERCGGAGKVEFTEGDEPEPGSSIRLECGNFLSDGS